jgi:proprotein convertase subtilisin/kexin type 5
MYNGVCYNSCPAQTYVNGSVCINCVAPCYNCTSNTTSSCTSCTGGLYLSTPTLGTCATTCNNPIYQLYDQVNFLCVSSCTDNLVQVGVNTCQMCASGLFKNSSNLCNDTCPAGYYPDSTRRFCGLCDVSCQSCIDVYAQNCTACWPNATNSYLYIGQCVFNTSCPDGTYADSVALACQSCPVAMNCSTCQNTTALGVVCIECNYGWFMSTAGTCDAGCASNQYANNGNNSCVNCNPGCASCTSPTNTSCTTCAKNSFLLTNASGGYCLSTCPPIGYYNDSTQCLVCYSSCNTCTDGLISSNY